MHRAAGTAGLTLLVGLALATPASAFTSSVRDGGTLASAMDAGGTLVAADFESLPPSVSGVASADATSTSPLTKFPRKGPDYAILTTGNPQLADDPNTSEQSGADLKSGHERGDSDLDVSVLKVEVDVPSSANCLSFDFRFLSEEYPEFINAGFNDAFVAELDTSDWTTSEGRLTAPHDFALDAGDSPITIDAVGSTGVVPERAATSTYDAATRLLRASTPVSPGNHDLYLSIFDQGDGSFDSAVFVDNLTMLGQSSCEPGVVSLDDIDPLTKFKKRLDKTTQRRPRVKFKSSEPGSTFECKLDNKLWRACESPDKLKKLKRRRHKVRVRAIDSTGNVDPTPATDSFRVLAP
jgi:hypothetical protein